MLSKTKNSTGIGLSSKQREFLLRHFVGVKTLKKGAFNAIIGPFEKRFGFRPNIIDARRLLQEENGNASSRQTVVKRPRYRGNRIIALT